MNKRQKISNKPNKRLEIDCQDNALSIILWTFSEAYFPACNAIVSLINLPMINTGMIYTGFSLEMPAPKKRGVVGSGNNE